jgi:hypothetical protein
VFVVVVACQQVELVLLLAVVRVLLAPQWNETVPPVVPLA